MTLKETLGRIRRDNGATLLNEETTKFQIIVPILSDLGWDVYKHEGTDEVRFEHPVGGSRDGGRVDIALVGEHGRCECFVEAKKLGANLDSHVDQLLEYAFLDEVTVCVLTNGLEWRLYLPRASRLPADRLFAHLLLREDPVEQLTHDMEMFLSRSAIVSGKAEQDATRALKRLRDAIDIVRELPGIWRKMLTEPDQELVNRIRSRMYDELSLSPSVDQVTEILSATSMLSQPASKVKQASRRSVSNWEPGESRKITGATVLGEPKSLKRWIGIWAFVVEQVYVRHEHDFWEKVAWLRPDSKRVFISEHPQKINRPRETRVSGVFIERSLGTYECIQLSQELLEIFGYSDSDLQIHEE